jgi:hypothetical protein
MAVRFPRIRGRTYAYRSLAITLAPRDPDTVPGPLPKAGGYANSEPGSRRMIGGDASNGSRSFVNHTDAELQLGPPPNRIDNPMPARHAGIIGRDISGWPYDGSALLIPHQMIPRKPITISPFARTIDTGVTIPAIPIGGPVDIA